MVLAVEQPIEDFAQRADMMQVVQDDDERHVHSVVLTGALVGKVGQVLTQFLQRPGEEQGENAADKDAHAEPILHPGQRRGKGPSRAVCLPACYRGWAWGSGDVGWARGEKGQGPAFWYLLGQRKPSAQGQSTAPGRVPRPGSIPLLHHFSTSVITSLDIYYYVNLPGSSQEQVPYTSLYKLYELCIRCSSTASLRPTYTKALMNLYSRGPLPQHALLINAVADRQPMVHREMGLHAQGGLEGLLETVSFEFNYEEWLGHCLELGPDAAQHGWGKGCMSEKEEKE